MKERYRHVFLISLFCYLWVSGAFGIDTLFGIPMNRLPKGVCLLRIEGGKYGYASGVIVGSTLITAAHTFDGGGRITGILASGSGSLPVDGIQVWLPPEANGQPVHDTAVILLPRSYPSDFVLPTQSQFEALDGAREATMIGDQTPAFRLKSPLYAFGFAQLDSLGGRTNGIFHAEMPRGPGIPEFVNAKSHYLIEDSQFHTEPGDSGGPLAAYVDGKLILMGIAVGTSRNDRGEAVADGFEKIGPHLFWIPRTELANEAFWRPPNRMLRGARHGWRGLREACWGAVGKLAGWLRR